MVHPGHVALHHPGEGDGGGLVWLVRQGDGRGPVAGGARLAGTKLRGQPKDSQNSQTTLGAIIRQMPKQVKAKSDQKKLMKLFAKIWVRLACGVAL